MTGKTHMLFGLCIGITTSAILLKEPYTISKLELSGGIIIGSVLGSLLPDFDEPNSTIGRRCKPLSHLINAIFGHRGITHAPIIHIILINFLMLSSQFFSNNIKLLGISFIIGLFLGGISHLILDSATVMGIPLLYPFSKRTYPYLKFKTGSKSEVLIRIAILVITIIILIQVI